jgi:pilus assembly protein CpaE
LSDPIDVLIVDDVAETRQNVRTLLSFEPGIRVVGEAANGREAVALAKRLRPSVILMDINMPVADGIEATEIISRELPSSSVVIMSVQGEYEYLRKAMAAGARDYLVKPFTAEELIQSVRNIGRKYSSVAPAPWGSGHSSQLSPRGKIVTVFSTKGGIGKTCIAANLAVALRQCTDHKVCAIDLDLQFGDMAVLLDLQPSRTLADLAREETMDSSSVLSCMLRHESGVELLAAPVRPEQAEIIAGKHVDAVLRYLRESYDYVVVDTPQSFQDPLLAALDLSDVIVLVVTLEVPTIKSVKLCMEVMDSLRYPPEKTVLVLNRSSRQIGVRIADLESALGRKVDFHIPSDGRLVIPSVNSGVPFVRSHPSARISQAVTELALFIARQNSSNEARPVRGRTSPLLAIRDKLLRRRDPAATAQPGTRKE